MGMSGDNFERRFDIIAETRRRSLHGTAHAQIQQPPLRKSDTRVLKAAARALHIFPGLREPLAVPIHATSPWNQCLCLHTYVFPHVRWPLGFFRGFLWTLLFRQND